MLKNTRSVLRIPCPAPSLSSASSFNPKENPLRPRSRCACTFPSPTIQKRKNSLPLQTALCFTRISFSVPPRSGREKSVTSLSLVHLYIHRNFLPYILSLLLYSRLLTSLRTSGTGQIPRRPYSRQMPATPRPGCFYVFLPSFSPITADTASPIPPDLRPAPLPRAYA